MQRLISKSGMICAALCLAVALPLSAALASDFVWQASTYNDAAHKGRYTARLRYQVPETDNVRFDALCIAGSSGRFATVIMGYRTGSLLEGSSTTLRVATDSYREKLRGSVYGNKAENGVSGVLMELGFNAPFWEALAEGSALSYRIKGKGRAALGLNGSGKPVRKFIADCKAIYKTSNRGATRGTKRPTKLHPTCSRYANAKSRRSDRPVTVTFVNWSGAYRSVMWINFKGRPVTYADLNDGQSYTVKTFLTHPWMFTDGPGNCMEMFMPKRGVRRFEIRAKSPAFGPGND